VGIFENLFAPGARHRTEEQRRLELTREETGEGEPGRGPIDLDGGRVVIRRPTADAKDSDAQDDVEPSAPSPAPSDPVPSDPAPSD
jgi:hypothetical protein